MAKLKDIRQYKSPGDTVIVKPTVTETQKGGIYIPETLQEANTFEVIETGLKFSSKDVKIGDFVLISGKGGDRIDVQDGTYWIFPTDLIVATVDL